MGRVDLDPYLPGVKPEDSANTGQPAEPRSRDERIDLTGLGVVDANLHLSVGALQAGKIRVADSTVAAQLTRGRLNVDLTQFSTYQGGGHGKLTVDASQDELVSVDVAIDLGGVNMESLLRDAAGFDRVSGTGTLRANLAARGRTERQLVESLRGSGRLDVREGAIKGIDLVALVLHASTATTVGDPSAKRDFSEMGGSFTVANGIVTNNDLSMKSPLLQVTGAGTVDLGHGVVDYKVTPKVVTPLVGQLGLGTPGVMVPVLIRGPFGDLRYEPDMAGLIRQGYTAPVDIVEGIVKMPGALLGTARMVLRRMGRKRSRRLKRLSGRSMGCLAARESLVVGLRMRTTGGDRRRTALAPRWGKPRRCRTRNKPPHPEEDRSCPCRATDLL